MNNKKGGKGGWRPGAGRPRRRTPATRTNLALSQEVRELLALAGDGDMSEGAAFARRGAP